MKYILNFLIAGIFLTSLFACGSKTESAEEEQAEIEAYDEATQNLPTTSIWESLPNADEVAATIQLTGAEFVEGLVNDPANVTYYIDDTEGKMAALVGAYFSDISYTTMYDQDALAYEQFVAAQQLADTLGIGRSLAQGVAERFKSRLEGNELATEVLNEAFKNANQNLRDGNRSLISAATACGWWIEGLYLLTEIVKTYPDDLDEETRNVVLLPLTRGILYQGKRLEQLITIVEQVKPDNQSADFFVYDLYDLKASFDKIDIDGVIENADPSTMLSTEDLAEISGKVEILREQLVAP